MLRIALCDDKRTDLAELLGLLEDYQRARPILEMEIHSFLSASGILDTGIPFDIFLLDILMPGLSGIELGRELCVRYPACPILYLTTSRDFALASYRTKAMSYLVKPVDRDELFDALDRAVEHCALVQTQAFPILVEGGIRRVFYHELVCVEAAGRVIEYFLLKERVASTTRHRSFAELWELLQPDGRFLLVRRGCLVNMEQVELLSEAGITLTGGQMIPIPRQRRKAVWNAYLEYCQRWSSAEAGRL